MASKTAEVQQRILSQAEEDEPNFFDDLVSGGKADASEEEDPFDQMVAEVNKAAESETSSSDTPIAESSGPVTEDPLEL